jgi:hypothetical protein
MRIEPPQKSVDALWGYAEAAIPWTTEPQWREAQAALKGSLGRWPSRMARARHEAATIAHHLDRLADLFAQLESATCAVCPAPCCRHAKVWLDFQDLLFLHLHGEPLPPHQLRRNWHEPCRYLGARGCRLPHRARPWICSWYICPDLRRAIAQDVPGGGVQIAAWQTRIKSGRDAMEAAYFDALGLSPAA